MQKIINFFLQRPLLVIILALVLISFGIKSYLSLHIEANPEITTPVIYTAIPYPGAGAEEVEEEIAYPLEEKLKEISEIEELTSLSWENVCIVIAFFKPRSDVKKASQLFKGKIQEFKNTLPAEVMEPYIEEVSFSNLPLMFVGLKGENLDELNEKANLIKKELEKLEGVREVVLTGNSEEQIQIQVDAEKLKNEDPRLLKELVEKLNEQNINFPGGKFTLEDKEYTVRTIGKFRKIKDLENLPLKQNGEKNLFLKDIAEVKKISDKPKTIVRVEGEKGITLGIIKKEGYGTIDVCDKIKKHLKKYKNILIISDQSEILKILMRELKMHALIGALLVLLVLFITLGKRSAIIVSIALPLSIMLTFISMYFQGMTLNMVSLFALVLTLGMVVDNAIVVCENIYRHLSMGDTPLISSLKGTEEVIWPILSSTLTIIAAFLPLLTLQGVVGEYISPISLVVTYAIISSLIVAIVFTPTFTKVFLKVERTESKKWVEKFRNYYRIVLKWSLEHSLIVLSLAIIIFISALKSISLIGIELFPKIDASRVYIDIKTPPASSIKKTEDIVKKTEDILITSGTVEKYFSNTGSTGQRINIDDYFYIGSNRARIILDLKSQKELKKPYSKIISELREKIKKLYPDIEVEFQEKRLGLPTGTPISIKILGEDLEELKNLTGVITAKLKSIKGVVDIKNNYPPEVPEVQIRVKQQKLAKFGLTTKDFGSFIFLTLQGYKISEVEIKEGGSLKKLPVILKIKLSETQDIANLQSASFSTKDGKEVLFSDIAKIRVTSGIGEITHEYGERCVNITANIAKGQLASRVVEKVKKDISKIKIPAGFSVRYEGENKMLERTFADLKKALLISLILIYLILLIEFRSSLQPLVILTCVPYALVGVILGLIITKNPFGVLSFIGIICLSGVVVNNAIIMIDYINNLRRSGVEKKEAILSATQIRIRPILITKATIILGVLPLALGIGESGTSHIWAPLAWSLIWGLIIATTLTLIIIPVVYNIIEDLKNIGKEDKSV